METEMVSRRTLLLAVAALLCVAAVYAIAIVLVGRFGRTEARVIGTTAVLVAMSLLALPAVMLTERHRALRFARAAAAAAIVGAALGIATIWHPGDTMGKLTTTVVAVAAFGTQAGALLARAHPGEPPVVHRLYVASVVSGATLASMVIALAWGQYGSGYGRAMMSVAIVDALLVALQPLLARLRPLTPR